MSRLITRRGLIQAGLTAIASASGAGAAVFLGNRYGLIPPNYASMTGIGETLTYSTQRLLTSGNSRAREFARDDISKPPIVNGPHPQNADYARLLAGGFEDWRLSVEGLVARPAEFSLTELKNMPYESHILLHACEEGWSYIAEWTGLKLSTLLNEVGVRPEARYAMFVPFANPNQTTGVVRVLFETIDMADAFHPQTLLAYGMNGETLPADFGAPLRLRLARHFGYKNTKYLTKIVLTDRMDLYRKNAGTWYGGI